MLKTFLFYLQSNKDELNNPILFEMKEIDQNHRISLYDKNSVYLTLILAI